jgi:hypothetical protein
MRPLVSFVLVAAVLLAGCGAASSGPQGQSPAQAELIAKADAICRRLNVEIATTKPKHLGVHEIARLSPVRANLEQATVKDLSKLTPPASIADNWRQLIGYRRRLAEELAKLGRSAKAHDVAAIKALTSSKLRVHRQLLIVGRHSGFKACALVG